MTGHWIAGAAFAAMLAQPVAAQGLLDNVTNEDIGRVIGGVGGVLIGSQIGGGSGRLVGAAVGGVGGVLLGGELGRRLDARHGAGVSAAGNQALETGQPVAWTSEDGAVSTNARVVETEWRPAPTQPGGRGVVAEAPPIELIGRPFRATSNANVRGGPSTDFAVMGGLRQGETVVVVGKVIGENWMLVSRDGIGRGFVFGDLLTPAEGAVAAARPASDAALPDVRECSVLEQEVSFRDGGAETVRTRACRNASGAWEVM